MYVSTCGRYKTKSPVTTILASCPHYANFKGHVDLIP